MSSSQAKAKRFDLIDVLRGFAAISVVVYHSIDFFTWVEFPTSYGLVWFHWGWMGVDIFFVISGFVITLSALNQTEREGYDGFQKKFLARRAKRIIPLHYLALTIFLVFSPSIIHPYIFYDVLAHMLFIHNTIPAFHGSINAPAWSLGVEMQFYFLIAFCIYFLRKEYLLYLSLVFILVCYVWRALAFWIVPPDIQLYHHCLFLWSSQLPGMLDLFLAGILLAFFVKSPWFDKAFSGKYSLFIMVIFTAVFCYAVLSLYTANSMYWNNASMVIFFHTLTAISVALIILCFCQIKLSRLWRIILAPFIYLGVISYGIYLLHMPVILGVRKLHLGPEVSFAITICATIILAALSWEFFEKRFIKRN